MNKRFKILAFFAVFMFACTANMNAKNTLALDTVVVKGNAYLNLSIKAVVEANNNNALIVVTMDSIRVASFRTDKTTGLTNFKLPFGHVYQISVEKDGYYAKFTTIDTHIPPKFEKNKYDLSFEIELLKYVKGVDPSVLYQPLQLIVFHIKKQQFVVDEDYISSLKEDLEKFKAEYDRMKNAQ